MAASQFLVSTPASILFKGAATMKSLPTPLLVAYAVFLAAAIALYQLVVSDALSAMLTVAVMLQCLGVSLLAAQVAVLGTATGISAKALGVHSLSICCRLSSTLWLNGYLPVDDSGDWFYQAVDIAALVMEAWLLYKTLVSNRASYQEEQDTFPIAPLVLGAFVLAALFHADMNARPLFDTMWMVGLFLSAVAVMPQLWLLNHAGGRVEALMSHHIAVMAVATMLSGVFMYHAREDIVCNPWIKDVNHSVIAILGAHLLHLLLLSDFAYLYVKAIATQGLGCQLDMEAFATFV
eukprot:TRINITY_DN165_c0_g3_i1.p1 TRINITY_DN165_c0_g3~~TRINITY_DN165_c0_g3_i1.p1  ORF type:complete len:331 (+),score=67.68 TRINITY_DN165_c0_g3_i1:117-995(+)